MAEKRLDYWTMAGHLWMMVDQTQEWSSLES
jgi:hypothetical protein